MESAHGSHWGAPNVQRQWTPRRTASTATDIRRGFYRVFAPLLCEIIPELAAFGAKNLAAHSIENIRLHVGDAAKGWPGKYDVIVLTGSTPALVQSFFATLNPGGRLLAITGDAPVMKAMLYIASGSNEIGSVELFETCIAPLTNAPQPERFVF